MFTGGLGPGEYDPAIVLFIFSYTLYTLCPIESKGDSEQSRSRNRESHVRKTSYARADCSHN